MANYSLIYNYLVYTINKNLDRNITLSGLKNSILDID